MKHSWAIAFVLSLLMLSGYIFYPHLLIGAGYAHVFSHEAINRIQSNIVIYDEYRDQNGSSSFIQKADHSRLVMHDGYPTLTFPGHWQGVSGEQLYGAALALIPPNDRRNALVLGFGSGITAGFVASHFNHTDVYEVRPSIMDLAHDHFSVENRQALKNDRLSILMQDGIYGLIQNEKAYDGIWINVPNPSMRHSEKLFTKEAFTLVHDSLTDSGLAFFWLHWGMGEEAMRILLHTMHDVFAGCRYVTIEGAYFMAACHTENYPTDFNNTNIYTLQDQNLFTGTDFGKSIADNEITFIDPTWFASSHLHTFDHPYFDTRNLFIEPYIDYPKLIKDAPHDVIKVH